MKKLLSVILVLAMLLSLAPAVFAEDAAEGEAASSGVKIVYDLSSHMEALGLGSVNGDSMTEVDYEITDGFYRFLENPNDATHYKVSTNGLLGWYAHSSAKKRFIKIADNAKVSFEINVPAAGIYDFEMYNCLIDSKNAQNGTSNKDTVVNVYISRNGISTAAADFKGSYTSYAEGKSWEPVTTPNVIPGIEFPEAGKYTITFKSTCVKWVYNTIGTFALNGGSNLVPMMSSVTSDKGEIAVGEEAQITATAALMSDAATVAEGVTYTYASSDNAVATVDASGKVTGVAMGTATITATATKGGYSSSGTVDVTVKDPKAAGINLTYNIGTRIPTWGSSVLFKDWYSYDNEKDLLSYYTDSKEKGKHENGSFRCYHDRTPSVICIDQRSLWWAATIRVPVSGKYEASVNIAKRNDYTGALGVYLIEKNSELGIAEITSSLTAGNLVGDIINQKDTTISGVVAQADPERLGVVELEAGEYYLVFRNDGDGLYAFFGDFFLNGYGDGIAPIIADCEVSETLIEKDEAVTIAPTTRYLTDGNAAANVAYTYKSSDDNIATVDASGKVTAKNGGKVTVTVSATADGATLPGTRTVDFTVNTSEYSEAFGGFTPDKVENLNPAVSAVAYAKGGATINVTPSASNNGNGTWTVSTAQEADGYTFRYWVRGCEDASKGNKRIVSLSNEFTYSPEKGDRNWLIAVYTNDSASVTEEFFNANGQLIPDANEAYRPYMVGYGQATGWKDNGSGIYEAVYGNGREKYNITVNGKEDTYYYGDAVICSAEAKKNGQFFLGWKKDGKIVSADTNYTFYAWKGSTVEAVYADSEPFYEGEKRKIVVDTFTLGGYIAIMAEFIGFEDAVERGITIDGRDYAMTRKSATQFTIMANGDAEEISAYAILADGTKLIYNN